MKEGFRPNTPEDSAIAQIKAIKGEVAVMGFNDYEIPALDDLISCLEKRTCTPEEALRAAEHVRDSKQDYH